MCVTRLVREGELICHFFFRPSGFGLTTRPSPSFLRGEPIDPHRSDQRRPPPQSYTPHTMRGCVGAYRVCCVCCHVGCEGGILEMEKSDYGRRKKLTDGEKILHYGRKKKGQQLTGKGEGRGGGRRGDVSGVCGGVGGVCVCRVVVCPILPISLDFNCLHLYTFIRSIKHLIPSALRS